MRYGILGLLILVLSVVGIGILAVLCQRRREVKKVRQEFIKRIKNFSGMIDPLDQAVRKGETEVAAMLLQFFEQQMEDCPMLAAFFRNQIVMPVAGELDPLAAGRDWIAFLESCGLRHDTVSDILVVDCQNATRYMIDRPCKLGDQIRVIRASWYLEDEQDTGGLLVEQGAAQLVEEE